MGCRNSTPTNAEIVPTSDSKETSSLMENCVLKFDHFENIHRLKVTIITADSPNFRKVKGFEVFGTGQPTITAFKEAVTYVRRELNMSTILWTNMRQEPVVYANGMSFTPREATRLNENMEFPNITGTDLESLQEEFVAVLKKRAASGQEDEGKVRYYKDTYAEHPEDRKNIEYVVELHDGTDSLKTLSNVYDDLRKDGVNLKYARLPIVDEKAPKEGDFDLLVEKLKIEPKDTACFFNCQMGKGRTTTGMIIACLIKNILHNTGEDVIAANAATYDNTDEPAYNIIDKLIVALPAAASAKILLDSIIDLCGEPPRGDGLQNLRHCIKWTKEKYDLEPEHKRAFWKHMGVNFIERYFYLICFATYVSEDGPNGLTQSFSGWMNSHSELRDMIKEGMAKFAWV